MKYFCVILIFLSLNVYAVDPKDPKLRDEDISGTSLLVDVNARDDDTYEYNYIIVSGETNKGTIANLSIDLSCLAIFEPVDLPDYSNRAGFTNIGQPAPGTFSPVAIDGQAHFCLVFQQIRVLCGV